MGRNTSISLGNHFEDFVDDKVSTGRFKNASEVIRAGLRLLEEEESKILALRKAIEEGIESGVARNFDPKKHLEKIKAVKRKKWLVTFFQKKLFWIYQQFGNTPLIPGQSDKPTNITICF